MTIIPTRPMTLRERVCLYGGWLIGTAGASVCAFLLGLMAPRLACASELGLHLVTVHRKAEGLQLRTVTPGIYFHADNGLGAGLFNNSHGDAAAWFGYTLERPVSRRLDAGVMLGGIVGYKHTGPTAAPIPSLKWRIHGPHAVRLNYLPKKPGEPRSVDGLHLMYAYTTRSL